MKKALYIISCFCLLWILVSCTNKVEIPVGQEATKPFTVDKNLASHAIYQANQSLEIGGTSQKGVVIVLTLLDSRGFTVNKSYCITDNNGNWKITLEAPKASEKAYSIIIHDSKEKYQSTFSNLRFGEVWLFLGDPIVGGVSKLEKDRQETAENPNHMFYIDGTWVVASGEISMLGQNLIDQMIENDYASNKTPIGIVFATAEEPSNAYSWLSREIIDSRTPIKKYLETSNLYKDGQATLQPNDMAYYSQTKLQEVEKMTFSNIVWHQGSRDFLDYNQKNSNFVYEYSQVLFAVLSELVEKFASVQNILVMQESSSLEENIGQLRKVQMNMCRYFSKCKIVTTYDLNVVVEKGTDTILSKNDLATFDKEIEIKGLDYQLLAKRFVNLSKGKNTTEEVRNILQVYNDKKEVTSVKLIFNDDVLFDEVNAEKINGLKFFDENNEEIELKYEIMNNQIIIHLVEEAHEVVDEKVETILHHISKIAYAQDSFIYDNNLSVKGIAICPFEFTIEDK